jgi:hypothetical protein
MCPIWTHFKDLRDVHLPCHERHHGEVIGIEFDNSQLFKHPLKEELILQKCSVILIKTVIIWRTRMYLEND